MTGGDHPTRRASGDDRGPPGSRVRRREVLLFGAAVAGLSGRSLAGDPAAAGSAPAGGDAEDGLAVASRSGSTDHDRFVDDYSDGDLDEYVVIQGSRDDWNVEPKIDGNSLHASKEEGNAFAVLDPDRYSWSGDRDIEVDFQVETANWKKNGHVTFYDGDDRWEARVAVQGDDVSLQYDENDTGDPETVAKSEDVGVPDDPVHHLSVGIRGSNVTVTLDGTEYIDHDHQSPIGSGTVGVGTVGGIPHETWFDDLTVTSRDAGTVATERPDLDLSVRTAYPAGRESACPGETVTLEITVENRGLARSTGIEVTVENPGERTDWPVENISGDFDRLPPGEQQTESVTFRVPEEAVLGDHPTTVTCRDDQGSRAETTATILVERCGSRDPDGVCVCIDPIEIVVGQRGEACVYLRDVDVGFDRCGLFVNVPGDLVEITDVRANGAFGDATTGIRDDGTTARFTLVDADDAFGGARDEILLGCLELECLAAGEGQLTIDVVDVIDDYGLGIEYSTNPGPLTCVPPDTPAYEGCFCIDPVEVPVGTTAEACVHLENLLEGFAGCEVEITVPGGICGIDDVLFNDALGLTEVDVSPDRSSARIRVNDTANRLSGRLSRFRLFCLVIEGLEQGEGTIGAEVTRIDDDDGNPVPITVDPGTVTCVPPPTPACPAVDSPPAATDPDGDGRCEDVNGNGRMDFDDVSEFFAHEDDPAVRSNPDAFDFNDNGGIDFDDIVELFKEI